jgi:hypothetical protein
MEESSATQRILKRAVVILSQRLQDSEKARQQSQSENNFKEFTIGQLQAQIQNLNN